MTPTTGPPTPLVSVVMIIYQAERFLSEAVESVLAQSLRDWELILVDDGSTDASAVIAARFIASDPRIRCITHPNRRNRGMAASRALGIADARGRYVAFLDADDVYLPDRLARHAGLLDSRPDVEVVIGATVIWYSWDGGPERDERRADRILSTGATPGEAIAPPRLLAQFLDPRRGGMTGTCSVTFRRNEAEPAVTVPEGFTGLFEDQCLYARLLLTRSACVLDDPLAKYRQHDASHVSTRETDEVRAAERRFLLWLEAELQRLGLDDRELSRSLSLRLFPHRYPGLAAVRSLPRRTLRLLVRALESVAAPLIPRSLEGGFVKGTHELGEWRRRRRIRAAERRATQSADHD